jgi:hypothetical protein
MKHKLIIAFEIVDDKGQSVLPNASTNGASKSIVISDISIFTHTQIRAQVAKLVESLTQLFPQDVDCPASIEGARSRYKDDKNYINFLQSQIAHLGHFEIKE